MREECTEEETQRNEKKWTDEIAYVVCERECWRNVWRRKVRKVIGGGLAGEECLKQVKKGVQGCCEVLRGF